MKFKSKLNLIIRFPIFLIWGFLCTLFFCLLSPLFFRRPNLYSNYAHTLSTVGLAVLGIKVVIENPQGLADHQPSIFMGNHRSNMDMLTYAFVCPKRTIGIGKKELLYVPLIGYFLFACGFLLLDRSNKFAAIKSLEKIAERIKRKSLSVGVMPEGTRNKTEEKLLPFKKGPFHLALQSGFPIVPVVSGPVNRVFDWKNKSLPGGILNFKILDPILSSSYNAKTIDDLISITHQRMLQAYLELERSSNIAKPPL